MLTLAHAAHAESLGMQGMRAMQSDRATLCYSLLFFTRLCAGECDARVLSLLKRDGQSTCAPFEDRQQTRRLLLLLSCFCSFTIRVKGFRQEFKNSSFCCSAASATSSSRSQAFNDTAGLMIMRCIEQLLDIQRWCIQGPSVS